MSEAHQLLAFSGSLIHGEDLADTGHVVFVLGFGRLDRRELESLKGIVESAERDVGMLIEGDVLRHVFGGPEQELLAIGDAKLRMGEHGDTGLCTINPRAPRAFGTGDAVVISDRVLAEVLDGPVAVLS